MRGRDPKWGRLGISLFLYFIIFRIFSIFIIYEGSLEFSQVQVWGRRVKILRTTDYIITNVQVYLKNTENGRSIEKLFQFAGTAQ